MSKKDIRDIPSGKNRKYMWFSDTPEVKNIIFLRHSDHRKIYRHVLKTMHHNGYVDEILSKSVDNLFKRQVDPKKLSQPIYRFYIYGSVKERSILENSTWWGALDLCAHHFLILKRICWYEVLSTPSMSKKVYARYTER